MDEMNMESSENLKQQETVPVAVSSDASYTINFNEDGVFFEMQNEQGEGALLHLQAVLYDIERRGLKNVNFEILKLGIKRGLPIVKIAEPQEQMPADSDVFVDLSADEMKASLMLLPPVLDGQTKTADEILTLIKEKWNISFGINEELVRAAVQSLAYNKLIFFAQGQAPIKGKDGELIFLFNTKPSFAPKILKDGSADYKNLSVFESVAKDAVVVTSVPPEEGTDGFTVSGNVLPAQKGIERKLPKGRNVNISEDGRSLVAAKGGRVDYINGRVEISDVYQIKGDVDMGVGNVTFEGDVVVNGNVISGLTVQASGLIEVRGYVEAATLIAGKDIILRNGMQGMSQGRLESGGNIVARFIERSTIEAKGDIIADYIVQCMVTVGGSVIMKGKWGKVLGGVIRAGKEITARIIGSPSSDRTQIELGVMPEERAKLTKLDGERGQVKAQLNRINNILGVMPSGTLPPEKQAMRDKLADAKAQLDTQYNDMTLQLEELKQLLSANSGARVNVLKTIYPNVRIQIDSGVFNTKTAIEFATFRWKEGEVCFTACEIKQ